MKDFITTFKTIGEYNTWKSSTRFVEPNATYISGDRIVITIKAPNPYRNDYLTFTALEDTTFKFTKALQYSLNNGVTWETLAANTNSSIITAGSKILWKATLTPTASYSGIGTFSATGNFEVSGNIMSLLYGDNFIGQKNLTRTYFFYQLFNGNIKLVNAKNLVLPAIALTASCYSFMFFGCTSLTTAPELPAATLANNCYESMFQGCSSLTAAPELPATTLTQKCYCGMFSGCTSLTSAPELPATTLAQSCYYSMFHDCIKLTTAPEILPVTTLANSCYYQMFYGCTSLTTAPELPATTLAYQCYRYMFNGCNKLNYIKCLATDISATECTYNWVTGVSSTGTFVKAASMTSWTTGINGIPYNWTVQNA